MAVIPVFEILSEAGVHVMNLSAVNSGNYPQDDKKYTLIEGIRGNGGIVVEGSLKTWDLILKGRITASDYEALVSAMDDMLSNLACGTKLQIKWKKTTSTYYTYNVIRLDPIVWGDNLRTNYIDYTLTLKVNAWA